MNRIQFSIVLFLSGVVAFCVILQMTFVHLSTQEDARAQKASDQIQTGQVCFSHLEQMAKLLAQVDEQKHDPAIAALLDRNHIKIGTPPGMGSHHTTPVPGPEAAPSAPSVPSTSTSTNAPTAATH